MPRWFWDYVIAALVLALVGIVIYMWWPGPPPKDRVTEQAVKLPTPSTVQKETAPAMSPVSIPESILRERKRLYEAEAQALSELITIQGKMAGARRELAELGARDAEQRVEAILGRSRDDRQRAYEDAHRRRLDFESQQRARYGDLPEVR